LHGTAGWVEYQAGLAPRSTGLAQNAEFD